MKWTKKSTRCTEERSPTKAKWKETWTLTTPTSIWPPTTTTLWRSFLSTSILSFNFDRKSKTLMTWNKPNRFDFMYLVLIRSWMRWRKGWRRWRRRQRLFVRCKLKWRRKWALFKVPFFLPLCFLESRVLDLVSFVWLLRQFGKRWKSEVLNPMLFDWTRAPGGLTSPLWISFEQLTNRQVV